MLQIGDNVAIKKGLVLGKKYGSITFSRYHSQYCGKLLRVVKVSKVGTVYCNYNGCPCEFSTIHECMLDVAKFKVGDLVAIWDLHVPCDGYTENMIPYANKITTITDVRYGSNGFVYTVGADGEFHNWPEKALFKVGKTIDSSVENLKEILEGDENQLQRKDSNIRSGEGVKGSRVHGRSSKASIRSRPLRNAKSIRGK